MILEATSAIQSSESETAEKMSNQKLFLNLFRNAEAIDFSAGQTIFDADEPGLAMFVILSGEVDILIGDKLLETLSAGNIFGELALIDDGPRSARAVARTECQLASADRRRFEFMVQETPYFALAVMQILADRLRRTDARVAKLA